MRVYCIYLASAVRCRSDRQAGQAKQHAQIAHTKVTLSGPSTIRNNSLSIPADLRLADTTAPLAPCFPSQVASFSPQVYTLEIIQYHSAGLLRKCYLLIKKESKKERAENELLSTLAPCVDAGRRSNLLNVRTKHAQKHFSVCPLHLQTRNKTNQTQQNVQQHFSYYNLQRDIID